MATLTANMQTTGLAVTATALVGLIGLMTLSQWAREAKDNSNSGLVVNEMVVTSIEPEKNGTTATVVTSSSAPSGNGPFKAALIEKHQVSPDTVMLKFKFVGHGRHIPVGKHLKIICPNPNRVKDSLWNDAPDPESGKEFVERKYTPVSSTEDGFVLVVKAYKPNSKFRDGGKVSQYLDNIRIGNEIEVHLPYGIMEYLSAGQFKKSKQIVKAAHVGMVAGGSGLTPMLRLLEASLSDPSDITKFTLLFANRSECDILLRERLDELAATFPERFRVAYTLTKPPEEWKGENGLITEDMLKAYMPPPHPSSLILCCGPPKMIENCCKKNLDIIGYSRNQVWDF